MSRRGAMLFGVVAGGAIGWMLAAGRGDRHRHDLFNPRPLRRLAALGNLSGAGGIESIRVLREYLEWERHPVLRRRARAMVRRMEAALG